MSVRLFLFLLLIYTTELSSQNFTQKIYPDDPRNGVFFGRFVDLNQDNAFISAYLDFENGTASGSLYVFDLKHNKFEQSSKLFPDDGAVEDYFSFSISSYGEYLISGAHHDSDLGASSGSVYILKKINGNWDFYQKIIPSDGKEADEFGNTVAMFGDFAVSCAYLDDDKGTNSGCVYILELVDNNWEITSKIYASDPEAQALFGLTLDINKTDLIVGAPYYNGSKTDIGKAYIFSYNGTEWVETVSLLPDELDDLDQFGVTVKITDNYAFVAAIKDDDKGENAGAVYIFSKNKEQNWDFNQKISAPDGASGDGFGVAIEANDTILFVGSYFDDDNGTNSGSVYVYKRNDNNWDFSKKITPTDGDESDAFGSSLSFNENGLLVGAFSDDDNGFFSGAAYYFSLTDINTVSISNIGIPGEIIVFPTIFKDLLTIEQIGCGQTLIFDIFDIKGSKMKMGFVKKEKETIDMSDLKSGVYLLKVRGSGNCHYFKLLKV